ncbi:MAG: hypothetical protein HYZ14_07205 [Bacteroidetes bacterium]|nr:hypothetical protein [Bacteroidota bacterium]
MAFTDEQIEDIKKITSDQLDAIIPNHLPVGTIISSLVNYDKFRDIVNDPLGFQKNKSKWSPADGRKVDTSKYASYLQVEKVPDLRGLFLRGLNKFDENESSAVNDSQKDSDGSNRNAGSFQNDEFKSHDHRFMSPITGAKVAHTSDGGVRANFAESTTVLSGGTETRPKNSAVYYYIKIN